MLWLAFTIFFILWILGLSGTIAVAGWVWLFFVIWILALIAMFRSSRRNRPSVP
ncbi:MAG TPA: hypothetical protein VFY05_07790 [Candidatus Angelobacter sp.]|nr:hypothetical protein [Candidatus Angelobacter sp.]